MFKKFDLTKFIVPVLLASAAFVEAYLDGRREDKMDELIERIDKLEKEDK